ncbi:hypothetical protein AB434_3754 [Heyndrickxia coagulans]|uniref:Uncharacterized protein n=1 Tax=Heyndrickxia coagulans TaxID=1398 RepID=A0AAN0T3Y2_HEYCO|nr:hypothetical protein SB48_HM08orf02389 [Heyndrickxia coagulans]AKN56159.1 hypothetical protein AB434_3754 [Heyndrickxia coagulans]KYC64983.1 hypothetical protein B4100_2861 [Heyndrickxia coagulans]
MTVIWIIAKPVVYGIYVKNAVLRKRTDALKDGACSMV